MLTISKPLQAAGARAYFRREFAKDYYLDSDGIGRWWGDGAERLGLTGTVTEKAFVAVIEGRDPQTGKALVRGSNRAAGKRRAGYDLTFSAPKSVSLLGLVGRDDRLVGAHNRAVTAALTEVERYARGRGHTPDGPLTGNLVVARFLHETSRELDPQLHTHCVTVNMTATNAGHWSALNSQQLFRLQRYATAVYRAALAEEVQCAGYGIVRGQRGAWDIAGVTPAVLDHFSQRREQILEALRDAGTHGAGAAQRAAHATRAAKKHLTESELKELWTERARAIGFDAAAAVDRATPARATNVAPQQRTAEARRALSFAIAHALEREAVTQDYALGAYALEHSVGKLEVADVKREIGRRVDARELVSLAGPSPHSVTSRSMLALEHDLRSRLTRGRNTHRPIAASVEWSAVTDAAGQPLTPSDEQRQVAEAVLRTRDRFFGIQGRAGTGKTYTLDAIRQIAEHRGFAVIGLAPTTGAVEALAESRMRAQTVAAFLAAPSPAGDRQLWVVDESSFLHTRDAHEIMRRAENAGARVVWVGDTNSRASGSAGQHHAVEAGAPFRALQDLGMPVAHLTQIQRQKNPELRAVVEAAARGDAAEAVRRVAAMGRLVEIRDGSKRLAAIAADYLADPSGALVLAPSNRERQAINASIVATLRERSPSDVPRVDVATLRARDTTAATRIHPSTYAPGVVVVFNRGLTSPELAPGTRATVVASDVERNSVVVELSDGTRRQFDPRRVRSVDLFDVERREIAAGDRLQFRRAVSLQDAPRIRNGALATVEAVTPDGRASLRLDSGRAVVLDLHATPYVDYGYAVTSYKSQGATARRVILAASTDDSKQLLNQAQTYVSLSRAKFDAVIYTDDATALPGRAARRVEKVNAAEQRVAPSVDVGNNQSPFEI